MANAYNQRGKKGSFLQNLTLLSLAGIASIATGIYLGLSLYNRTLEPKIKSDRKPETITSQYTAVPETLVYATPTPYLAPPQKLNVRVGGIWDLPDIRYSSGILISDGENDERILYGRYDTCLHSAALSPDQSKVAFAISGCGTENGIYTINLDGTQIKRLTALTSENEVDLNPSWIDNDTITFIRRHLDSEVNRFLQVDTDGPFNVRPLDP